MHNLNLKSLVPLDKINVDNKTGWFKINTDSKYTKWLYEGTYKGKIKVYGMEHPGSPIGYEKYREYFIQVKEVIKKNQKENK